MNNEKDVIEFDLPGVLRLLFSKIWSIITSALAGGLVFAIIAIFAITPKYQSSALFYVNNNNLSIGGASFSISSSDISASQSLVDTYIVILNTRNTLETVIEKSNLPYSYERLSGMISASAVNGTEVFKVTVTSDDPKEACNIANGIALVLPDKISEIVTGSGAKIVDYAVANPNKVSPSTSRYAIIGALIGAVITSFIIVLKNYFDDTIKDDSYLLTAYDDVAILAIIPNLDNDKKGGSYYKSYYSGKYGSYKKSYKYGYYKNNEKKDSK